MLFSTLSPAQVLSKSNSGLTNPETIQVTGHASGSVPFQNLSSLSAQDVDGDGKVDLLVSGLDPQPRVLYCGSTSIPATDA